MDCSNCTLEKRVTIIEQETKQIWNKINAVDKQQGIIETKLDNILSIVQEMRIKVEELSKIPAQRWDKLVTGIVAGIISLLTTGIGVMLFPRAFQ